MDYQKHREVFFPLASLAKERAKRAGLRFAYYTTADVAYQVIKNKRMWMRSTTTMNDYSEIQYGRDLLLEAIKGDFGEKLKLAINASHTNLFEEVWQQVVAWLPGFNYATYITCVSEHDSAEDDLGRLSMWRAYGGKTGVALVFNGDVFDLQTNALGAYSSPVSYLNQHQFTEALGVVAENIEKNSEYISGLEREVVKIHYSQFFGLLCSAQSTQGSRRSENGELLHHQLCMVAAYLKARFQLSETSRNRF